MPYSGVVRRLVCALLLFCNSFYAASSVQTDSYLPSSDHDAISTQSLICLAPSNDSEQALPPDGTSDDLVPISEHMLKTLNAQQVLLIIREGHPVFSDLLETLKSSSAADTAAFADLIDSVKDVQRQCYASQAKDSTAIINILAADDFMLSGVHWVFMDKNLTAIYIDNKNSIALSNQDPLEAMRYIKQLNLDKQSSNVWIGTNRFRDKLIHVNSEKLEHYLHVCRPLSHNHHAGDGKQVPSYDNCTSISEDTQNEHEQGMYRTNKDPHHDATEALLWSSVALTLLLVILMPFAIFL